MIKTIEQNVLQVQAGIILHGCNAQGVMGAGAAAALSRKYPIIFRDYRKHLTNFNTEEQSLGSVCLSEINEDLYIASAITQLRYGNGEDHFHYDSFDNVIKTVCLKAKELNLPVYSVRIGSLRAGGDWERIEKIIQDNVPEDQEFYICSLPNVSKYQE